MKCQALVRKGKRGRWRAWLHPYPAWGGYNIFEVPNPPIQKLLSDETIEVCGGTLEARVSATDEPYMGGHSAILDISWCCDSCDNSYYPMLPSTGEAVAKMLTEYAESLPDPIKIERVNGVLTEKHVHACPVDISEYPMGTSPCEKSGFCHCACGARYSITEYKWYEKGTFESKP